MQDVHEVQGILLAHAELLFLLHAVRAKALVSIAPAHLFPTSEAELDALIQRGRDSLEARGLLKKTGDDRQSIDNDLLTVITTAAYPRVATLLVHNTVEAGFQLLWFYQSEDSFIEHTVTQELLHRFLLYPNFSTLLDRMEQIVSVQNGRTAKIEMKMEQDAFFTVKNMMEREENEQARAVLNQVGLSNEETHAFLHTLERLRSAGNIAFLRCSHNSVVDGRNIALLQDENTTWSARQCVAGQPLLTIETTDAQTVKALFRSSIEELLAV